MKDGYMSNMGKLQGTWKKGDVIRVPCSTGNAIYLLISDPDERGHAIWLDKFGHSIRFVDRASWTNDSELL